MHLDSLPEGVTLEAVAPDGVAIVWARSPEPATVDVLTAAGYLAVVLEPVDTSDFVTVSGVPALMVVDAALLDDTATELLRQIRTASPRLRVTVLAGPGAPAAQLINALRLGITEVVDPERPDELTGALQRSAGGSTGRRVLAVGAHPDDVEIGCGATLLRHRDDGDVVTVLTLSRGDVGGDRSLRRQEAVGAATTIGATLLMADFPDTRLGDTVTEMTTVLEHVISATAPTAVYVHSKADNHQDHRAVHDATVVAARRVEQLYCYQSPSSQTGFAPTRFVPVDAVIDGKVELLSHYRSQATRHYLEPDLVRSTARYWSRQLLHTRFAEPFEVLRASSG